jgi:AraC-like DNA-binding protein
VAFRPGGAAPFLDVPVSELRNRTVSLDAVWGRAGATLRERLRAAPSPAATVRVLTEALHEQLAAEGPPDVVTAAVERIRRANGQVSVQTLVEESGYSHRHFTDRFRRAVGLPPKRFSRIVRLQDVLRRIRASTAGNGARLAAACGYADQSHLIREMRRLTGITPEAYRRRAPAEPHHVPLTE